MEQAVTFEFEGFDFSGASARATRRRSAICLRSVFAAAGPHGARAARGADLHASVTLSFDEAMRGAAADHADPPRHVPVVPGAGPQDRPRRGVSLPGQRRSDRSRGHMVFSKSCDACGGSGRLQRRCGRAAGSASRCAARPIAVGIPAGVADGARIRVPEKGHAGERRGRAGAIWSSTSRWSRTRRSARR